MLFKYYCNDKISIEKFVQRTKSFLDTQHFDSDRVDIVGAYIYFFLWFCSTKVESAENYRIFKQAFERLSPQRLSAQQHKKFKAYFTKDKHHYMDFGFHISLRDFKVLHQELQRYFCPTPYWEHLFHRILFFPHKCSFKNLINFEELEFGQDSQSFFLFEAQKIKACGNIANHHFSWPLWLKRAQRECTAAEAQYLLAIVESSNLFRARLVDDVTEYGLGRQKNEYTKAIEALGIRIQRSSLDELIEVTAVHPRKLVKL